MSLLCTEQIHLLLVFSFFEVKSCCCSTIVKILNLLYHTFMYSLLLLLSIINYLPRCTYHLLYRDRRIVTGTIIDNIVVNTAKIQLGRQSNCSRQCGAIPLSNPKRLLSFSQSLWNEVGVRILQKSPSRSPFPSPSLDSNP